MITYLLKSGLCLVLIYLVYQLVLEREKMPIFNRLYLLVGLLYSFLVPLISIDIGNGVLGNNDVLGQIHFNDLEPVRNGSMVSEGNFNFENVMLALYLLITSVLLIRFLFRLITLLRKIKQNEKVSYNGVQLILLDQNILPYTFWKFIFVNKKSYQEKKIESELYVHEMAHVNQFHTLDILIIEILKVLFWFNPILRIYKKAIQMNHEFLADNEVIKNHQEIPHYQHLLLEKARSNTELFLSSNFNYLVTKKRIIMMTKNTSRLKSIVLSSMMIPFFTFLLISFGNTVQAQKAPSSKGNTEIEKTKDVYFQNSIIEYKQDDGPSIYKPYNELSKKEKSIIPPPPNHDASGKPIRVVPLPTGAVVSVDKDGKVSVDKTGIRIPPPPPAPPVRTKDEIKKESKPGDRTPPTKKERK